MKALELEKLIITMAGILFDKQEVIKFTNMK